MDCRSFYFIRSLYRYACHRLRAGRHQPGCKDYYNQELVYQEQISRMNNAAALTEKPNIIVTQAFIRVTFDSLSFVEHGKLDLFCPSDSKMDRSFEIPESDDQQFTYALSDLKPGMYRVKLLWSMAGKDYYQEEIVNL